MRIENSFLASILFFSLFILPSADVFSQQSQSETYEPQNVQKLESGRTNQLKSDADQRGRTEENKGNFETNVPRGDGIEYPPAEKSERPVPNQAPITPKGY